jgi:hypothetical protein
LGAEALAALMDRVREERDAALGSDGELKYVLPASTSSAKATGSSSDAVREILQAVADWVKANGTVVDAAAYGGLDQGPTKLKALCGR